MGYKEFAASILGKFGGSKNKQAAEPLTVYAPFGGNAIAMEEIPDPVFSEGILGKGCGLEPGEETVCAPFNGTVTQVIDTKHAVGVTSKDGVELLIHVGMDTVAMNGEGFNCLVKEGDTVKLGQKLMTFSMEAIKAAGHPVTTAVVVTNADDFADIQVLAKGQIAQGAPLLKAKK